MNSIAREPEYDPARLAGQALSPDQVRARFRWARRQGNPAWLWPEVTAEDWRAALKAIEASAGAVLLGHAPPVLQGEPAAIGLAGYTSGMGPLLGWWIEQGRIDAGPDIAEILRLHLDQNRLRARRMELAARKLTGAFARAEIPVAVLKGLHTGQTYFPDPATRPASDIDLLASEQDRARAEAILRSEGMVEDGRGRLESAWRPHGAPREPRSLSLVHADDPWTVDLHSSLDVPVGAGGIARLDRAGPLGGAGRWAASEALVLEQPILLLHLAVHAGSGLHNLTLLRLTELVLVIRQDRDNGRLDWPDFLEQSERCGSLGFAYPALSLCEALAPETVPQSVLDRCRSNAPPTAAAVTARLTPALAQRIDRTSVEEHFMWSRGWAGRLRQAADDLLPAVGWSRLLAIYEARAWRLVRGRFSP